MAVAQSLLQTEIGSWMGRLLKRRNARVQLINEQEFNFPIIAIKNRTLVQW